MNYIHNKHQQRSDAETTVSTYRDPLLNVKDQKVQIVQRLQQILDSLMAQKELVDQQRSAERDQLKEQIMSRQNRILQLEKQNKKLIESISTLTSELQKSQNTIYHLKKQNKKFQVENQRLKGIIVYLQDKNKQLHEQIFEKERTINRLELQSKKQQPYDISKKQSRKVSNCFDQQSILEYMGCLNMKNICLPHLRKSQSMPSFEITPQKSQLVSINENQISTKKKNNDRKKNPSPFMNKKSKDQVIIQQIVKKSTKKLQKKNSMNKLVSHSKNVKKDLEQSTKSKRSVQRR